MLVHAFKSNAYSQLACKQACNMTPEQQKHHEVEGSGCAVPGEHDYGLTHPEGLLQARWWWPGARML